MMFYLKNICSKNTINHISSLSSDVTVGETATLIAQANHAIVVSTTILLTAGRFGLAPTANKIASSGLRLQPRDSGLKTGDPAGFTFADTLAYGSMGHILGIGIYFGTVGTK